MNFFVKSISFFGAFLHIFISLEPIEAKPYEIAVLQALDKVTARVFTVYALIDNVANFGTLEIVVRRCDRRPPEDPPESAAFLEIVEAQIGKPKTRVFNGWMFASSPALSALEHPVYDVWVTDCVKSDRK